jgi:aspartate kinase
MHGEAAECTGRNNFNPINKDMQVYKFGGASVKDAKSIQNVAEIIQSSTGDLIIVISAMGKMTNLLEDIVMSYFSGIPYQGSFANFKRYHDDIIMDLNLVADSDFMMLYSQLFVKMELRLAQDPSAHYDYEYDQLVCYGELVSTTILSGYLNKLGIENEWLDARKIIRTDNNYRDARVDWELTQALFLSKTGPILQNGSNRKICIIQGFIGHTETGQVTTLGREGSDFSAAIVAWCLDAQSVTIWKDVPGMLNADPKYFNNTQKLAKISFREAIELSYYGASVIHPKTIKPLQNKAIPLYVKSFLNPTEEGTVIQESVQNDTLIPSYIFKENQVLISISPRDFSFMVEENMRDIFELLDKHKIRINLMQNSAISFSICVDFDTMKVPRFIEKLSSKYVVKYNESLKLLTIRHYNDQVIDKLVNTSQVLVEQKSRQTARFVLK